MRKKTPATQPHNPADMVYDIPINRGVTLRSCHSC